ncbi:MAG TPA: cysteine--tRNA ligase [Dehalococcoidales bacterium]|nr:cysteine--tRNA ligase [Dehalococcoidales bacterium]
MKILNTLSGQKEEFTPFGETVKMYVCGITPYDNSHFGHAMSYVFFDVIRRYLIFRGYKVKYVQNVTDIDDKIILRANQRGISTTELAEKFAASYFEDMAALNVITPDVTPRATQEVPKIIEVIEGLIAKGYAYPTPDGSVYFRVRQDEDYGQLSHRTADMMLAGARIDVGEIKENPMDFALWKASKPGEPAWDSPWGKGRPGWHIECTAMSMKYLGEQIDIHAGGMDLVFPHHENEIAQTESFTGKKPFVKYWLHNGFLQIGEEKMSKSLGNMLTIKEVLAKYSADAIRTFILSSHYRSPLSFAWEGLDGALKGAERLARAANRENPSTVTKPLDTTAYRQQFMDAMDDDFNSAKAIGILFDLARDINQAADNGANIVEAVKTLKELAGNVLGLQLTAPEKLASAVEAAPFIELLIQTRLKLRQAKQFQLADEIRNKLTELGIWLEDTPKGTTWRKK